MALVSLKKEGPVGIITFNRPEARNALNEQMLDELRDAVRAVMEAGDIRVLVFTGRSKSFISGADTSTLNDPDHVAVLAYSYKGRNIFREIELLPIPTIAAINGYAFGGGLEFALCCDIRVAAKSAKMGLPEVGLGITPGFSGTQRLPRVIGPGLAKEMMYSGKPITAGEALSYGLVNHVYENESLMDDVMALAGSIAKNSPYAISFVKKEIDRGLDLDIQSGLDLETGYLGMIFGSKDQLEGFAAMKEKRAPEFLNPGESLPGC